MNMPITKADWRTRQTVAKVLAPFMREPGRGDAKFLDLTAKAFSQYPVNTLDSRQLTSILRKPRNVRMLQSDQYLLLEPTRRDSLLPLVTLQSSHEWRHFRIYTLLAKKHGASSVASIALRFETDEGSGGGSHDYCHVQICRSIGRHPATNSSWLPESEPAFPLDADNQVSLVLCLLTSLYGGRSVLSKLQGAGIDGINTHLRHVRALRT